MAVVRATGMAAGTMARGLKELALGSEVPSGQVRRTGWVSVSIDHDTATSAVPTSRSRWHELGAARYSEARRLTITTDVGGSNGSRVRLWKYELQQLADELGIDITVHHRTAEYSVGSRHRAC